MAHDAGGWVGGSKNRKIVMAQLMHDLLFAVYSGRSKRLEGRHTKPA